MKFTKERHTRQEGKGGPNRLIFSPELTAEGNLLLRKQMSFSPKNSPLTTVRYHLGITDLSNAFTSPITVPLSARKEICDAADPVITSDYDGVLSFTDTDLE